MNKKTREGREKKDDGSRRKRERERERKRKKERGKERETKWDADGEGGEKGEENSILLKQLIVLCDKCSSLQGLSGTQAGICVTGK